MKLDSIFHPPTLPRTVGQMLSNPRNKSGFLIHVGGSLALGFRFRFWLRDHWFNWRWWSERRIVSRIPRLAGPAIQRIKFVTKLVNFVLGGVLLAFNLFEGIENFIHVLQCMLQLRADLFHLLDCPANIARWLMLAFQRLPWPGWLLRSIDAVTAVTSIIAIEPSAPAPSTPAILPAAVVIWPGSSRPLNRPLACRTVAHWPFLCRSFYRRPCLIFAIRF